MKRKAALYKEVLIPFKWWQVSFRARSCLTTYQPVPEMRKGVLEELLLKLVCIGNSKGEKQGIIVIWL